MEKVKILKRCVSACLAATVALGAAGCSGGGGTGSSKPAGGDASAASAVTVSKSGKVSDTPVTFTMLYADNSTYPFKQSWETLKKMKELTNVSLNVTVVPDADYPTKVQLLLNSGDIPDIVCNGVSGSVEEMALNGKLLCFSDYVKSMPNFQKLVKNCDLSAQLENSELSDGKMYSLPVNVDEKRVQTEQWFVRKDLFDKNNLTIPTTWDECYKDMKILKAKYPKIIPIQNIYGTDDLLCMVGSSFGTVAGWDSANTGFMYDKSSDKWIHAPTSDNYKAMLQFLHKLYAEGILDKEFVTLDTTTYDQRILKGQTIMWDGWLGGEVSYNEDGKKTDSNFNVVPIPALAGPSGKAGTKVTGSWGHSMICPASVKDKEYFNTLIRWLDWMYSEDGANLFSWGVKGVTYTENSDGTKAFTSNIISPTNPKGSKYLDRDYGCNNNNLSFVFPYDYLKATFTKEDSAVLDEESQKNMLTDPQPSLRLTSDEKEEENLVSTALKDYVDAEKEKFIMGKESFNNWDAYVKECDQKGRSKLSKLYNQVWQRQKSAK